MLGWPRPERAMMAGPRVGLERHLVFVCFPDPHTFFGESGSLFPRLRIRIRHVLVFLSQGVCVCVRVRAHTGLGSRKSKKIKESFVL